MDCSLSGSSVHGILQARIMKRVTISFPRGSSWPRYQTSISCVSCIAGGFFINWAIREASIIQHILWEMQKWIWHNYYTQRPQHIEEESSDQIRSVAQSCPTLCNPMNCSTPGLPVQHQLPEFTETHIHRVSDAIQPPHPLSSPSPLAPNPWRRKRTQF